MKKKGFTLIELLAVIVILAIIALIAVPVIMNIISEARKSAFKDTAYGIISAGEMYYAEKLLDPNGMTSDVEFTIEDGEFVGENKLEVKGALPTNGKIKIARDGKVALAISNGAMCITKGYDDSKINPGANLNNCELPKEPAKTLSELARTNTFATVVPACAALGTTCPTGEKFAIEVAPGNIQNFYVVSDADNKVTLIMDKNIGEEVAWITKSDYITAGGTESEWDIECDDCGNTNKGPLTALNYLESQTSSWTNIEAKEFTLTDSKYGTIKRPNARARMITKTEANAIISHDWSYGNLSQPPYGYWTSATVEEVCHTAYRVYYVGRIYGGNSVNVADNSDSGVRPVIEISK